MKLTTRPHRHIAILWQKNDIIYHNITYQIFKLICRYRVISLITESIGCRLNMHIHWINNVFFIISNFVNLRRLVWKRLFWDHTGTLLQYLKAIFTICRLNMWPWKWSQNMEIKVTSYVLDSELVIEILIHGKMFWKWYSNYVMF